MGIPGGSSLCGIGLCNQAPSPGSDHAQPHLPPQALDEGKLSIVPERFERVYRHWLSNIKDWCISRQLWWGHRLPVW